MENFLLKLLDLKKPPTTLLFVVCVFCGFVLFVPDEFLQQLSLAEFKNEYGKFLGFGFTGSLSFLVVALIVWFIRKLQAEHLKHQLEKKILRSLQNLDLHEKALLREFLVIHGKHTLELPFPNETVVSLSNKGIIYQASSTGPVYLHGAYFSYTISEYALENLDSQMLDLPKNLDNIPESEKERILARRPEWARSRTEFEERRRWL
ncbi:super-infection exclusion protein B [Tunicatimonas pelagia]|uniref:super-infection exclusion protein B n=1 Tax=Tunicatimonas pelagia TaxID=931531 RepID=UPI002665992F|nr:super-infection exclusion protein B [Tunicatimonas pelagia]WKN46527.1 super-infection exclusion protein B [Tunicatimonas pelagia]